jgi:POT family proton-dependent oligopeptide transporter
MLNSQTNLFYLRVIVREFKHPKVLKVFVFTEMWERYGFYVVQTLLALFLALQLKWPDEKVYYLVGSFTALNYLSPLLGGWIADHLIGQKRAILYGAFVLFLTYLSLTLMHNELSLFISLAGIPVGTGLLKPNISSLLGHQYSNAPSQRESGFTIFYMGLAAGIILGTTLPSIIHEYFGWSYAFASAALVMVFSGMFFLWGCRYFDIKDFHPGASTLKSTFFAFVISLVLWLLAFYILKFPKFADNLIIIIAALAVLYFLRCLQVDNPNQYRKTLTIGLLCIISTMFWSFYFQMFMSLTLFVVRVVKSSLFGFQFYPPYYISIQSIGLIVFGYFFAIRKNMMTDEEIGIASAKKFTIAVGLIFMSYLTIALLCVLMPGDFQFSPLLFIPIYLMISLAEILLSPVGLAAVSLLSNTHKVSTMVGMFFVTLGIGAYLSGKLASLTAIPDLNMSTMQMKALYAVGFMKQVYILTAVCVICLILLRLIKRLLSDK